MAMAVRHHQAGQLQAAEQIYRQVLAAEPNLAAAWNLLGVVSSQCGQHEVAVDYLSRAIGLNGSAPDFHSNLGQVYQALARRHEAIACFRRAVELKPDFVEAHHVLGNLLLAQGKQDEAVECYRRVLELRPEMAEVHNNLGNLLQEQGKPDEATDCYRRALQLRPDLAEAENNLGNVLWGEGKRDEAAACYRRALAIRPDFVEAHCYLGRVLQEQGKPDEAIACYRRALALKPNHAEAHNNLGNALNDQGRLDEAVACYRRALELRPNYVEAHNNLGNTFKNQRKLDEAVACYRRAVELKPDAAEAHSNLGWVLQDHRKLDEAIECFRRALELRPNYLATRGALAHELQHVCSWDGLEDLSRGLIEMVDAETVDAETKNSIAGPVSPFLFLTLPTITTAKQQLQSARLWVDRHLKAPAKIEHGPVLDRVRDLSSKITVGYLSADFQHHATAMLIAELFEKHDRGRFTILGYSFGRADHSPLRQRLIDGLDQFVDVKDLSFAEAADRIIADQVDILVDLKGYTTGARTQILARRPAPIQVNYLGYPGTMGARFIDYVLVDDFIVPPDQQPFFTENLVHLPGCYQANDSQREIASHTPSRAECGLPETGFVFCCFNNNYKITPAVFGVWMRLLQAIPGSVLWILDANRFAPANLRREAVARGVAAERLVFAPRVAVAEHLARHRLADLFLDTFPVNAHTTASEALWAGCPMLTIAGETFVSRVAGSLLNALGMRELVTTSLGDYEAMALRLARDPKHLANLRSRLQSNRTGSALFDGGQFAKGLEKAYVAMWEIYVSGDRPRAFRVSPDVT